MKRPDIKDDKYLDHEIGTFLSIDYIADIEIYVNYLEDVIKKAIKQNNVNISLLKNLQEKSDRASWDIPASPDGSQSNA